MQRLHHTTEPLRSNPLHLQRLPKAAILLSHRIELGGHLAGELDAVLDGRVGFEGFALDFFEQVGAAA